MQRRHPEPYPNIFFEMDGVHIQQVFDELADRFGFPEKLWKAKWRAHLDKQARGEDEVGLFLKFGNEHINPILNQLLLRTYSHATFSNLCEYVIKKSATYIELHRTKNRANEERLAFYTKRKI